MAGQRKDREERYEDTGLTEQARKNLIIKLRKQNKKRWTERALAERFGVAPSNIHYILAEADGNPRVQERKEMCECHWEEWPKSKLDREGLCPKYHAEHTTQ